MQSAAQTKRPASAGTLGGGEEDAVFGWLKCCFTCTETVGLLGTGAQDVLLDFHTASELCEDAAVCEFLLLSVHGGEKAYYGRGRVGKGG